MKNCAYTFYDNNNDAYPCEHTTYKGSKYCVFHHRLFKEKRNDFHKSLENYIDQCESSDCQNYNFRGFVFPYISYKNYRFIKAVDFRGAIFQEEANFEHAVFVSNVHFLKSKFNSKVSFQGVVFSCNAHFMGTEFKKKTIFVSGSFQNKAVFHGCKFFDTVVFQQRSFEGKTKFQSTIFFADADFQFTKFIGDTEFSLCEFRKRLNFRNSVFSNELKFNKVKIELLKDLKGNGILFDGSVLRSANFHNISTLDSYSFKNSFLLSCDLSRKKLINCDFTGAVFKSLLTENWKPDDKTIKNTKYIYTDYFTEKERDDLGNYIEKYKPRKETRVPIQGEFGDNKHIGFTIIDFAREPYKWEFLIDFPEDVQTGVINYLNFFKDYLKATRNINVGISSQPEGADKVRIGFITDNIEQKEEIISSLKEYISYIFKPFDRLNISFYSQDVDDSKKELILINLQNELRSTQARLLYGLTTLQDKKIASENFKRLLPVKDDSDYLSSIKNMPLVFQISPTFNINIDNTTSMQSNINIKNVTSIKITISELIDEINNLQKELEEPSAALNTIKNEFEQIQKKKPEEIIKQKSKIKILIDKLKELSGKLIMFGLSNPEKIIILCNELEKLF